MLFVIAAIFEIHVYLLDDLYPILLFGTVKSLLVEISVSVIQADVFYEKS